jgi:hypothetical protein
MGIFDSIARGLGSLRPLSDAELEDEREALRQRYVPAGISTRRRNSTTSCTTSTRK